MWSECRQMTSESEEVFGDLKKQVSNIIQYEAPSSCIGLLFTRKSLSQFIHPSPSVCLYEYVCGIYACVFVWTFTCGNVCRCQRRTLNSWSLPPSLETGSFIDSGSRLASQQTSVTLLSLTPFQCWIYRHMCGLSTWLLGIQTQAIVYWASIALPFSFKSALPRVPFFSVTSIPLLASTVLSWAEFWKTKVTKMHCK